MIVMSEMLRKLSASLKYIELSMSKTQITDVGVCTLVDALDTICYLSGITLHFVDCKKVTDQSALRLLGLLTDRTEIVNVTLNLQGSGMTQDGTKMIQEIKSDRHLEFEIC
eukprot:TRINITY_DN6752_c0_g1_i2.p1 TRINITY_DN6752_c0_g1~~TRINITY_DN6752_c0_g1_i2.p1  ORF type:complete len:111 (+),score=11.93 TRINITY_DN6752_c0_g1_i2:308-640(+)